MKLGAIFQTHASPDTPPVEPPILTLSSLGGAEDAPIPLLLSASDRMSSSSTGLVVKVITFPAGSNFSRGTFDGDNWIFNPVDFGAIELRLPQHLSGNITVGASAIKDEATREGVIHIHVQAVADPPHLTVEDTCYDPAVGSMNLEIQTSLIDNDGSETLSVIIAGIPENVTLSSGQQSGNDEYTLNIQDLANVEMQFLGNFQPFNFTITSRSTEMLNGDTAYNTTSVSIELCTGKFIWQIGVMYWNERHIRFYWEPYKQIANIHWSFPIVQLSA